MATYERAVRVRAPLEDVREFHSRIDGLEALTPGWLDLRVESVTGPDGDPDPAVLEAGAVVGLSMAPLGVGPRQRWTSRITERERREGAALFRDEMVEGPFPIWRHSHLFFADGEDTVVHDRVRYALPPGRLGRLVSPLAVVGLAPTFRYRHRRTRELLEADPGAAAAPR